MSKDSLLCFMILLLKFTSTVIEVCLTCSKCCFGPERKFGVVFLSQQMKAD